MIGWNSKNIQLTTLNTRIKNQNVKFKTNSHVLFIKKTEIVWWIDRIFAWIAQMWPVCRATTVDCVPQTPPTLSSSTVVGTPSPTELQDPYSARTCNMRIPNINTSLQSNEAKAKSMSLTSIRTPFPDSAAHTYSSCSRGILPSDQSVTSCSRTIWLKITFRTSVWPPAIKNNMNNSKLSDDDDAYLIFGNSRLLQTIPLAVVQQSAIFIEYVHIMNCHYGVSGQKCCELHENTIENTISGIRGVFSYKSKCIDIGMCQNMLFQHNQTMACCQKQLIQRYSYPRWPHSTFHSNETTNLSNKS